METFETFAVMVSEDIKNKADRKTKDYLRLEENREKWRSCLLTILSTVNKTISELDREVISLRSMYSGFDSDPASSISAQLDKANRFRFYAEKRLAEVDRLISLGKADDPSLSLSAFLRDAILAHKVAKQGNDPSDIDLALWSVLDGEWNF